MSRTSQLRAAALRKKISIQKDSMNTIDKNLVLNKLADTLLASGKNISNVNKNAVKSFLKSNGMSNSEIEEAITRLEKEFYQFMGGNTNNVHIPVPPLNLNVNKDKDKLTDAVDNSKCRKSIFSDVRKIT